MTDFNFQNFKNNVDEVLIRHKGILDIITKLEETNSKFNRAIVKSATSCGCIQIEGKVQKMPKDISFDDLSSYMSSQINGQLCETCVEKLQEELGNHIFYIVAACNLLDIDLESVCKYEYDKIKTLGKFGLY